jgi:hypothetical protein
MVYSEERHSNISREAEDMAGRSYVFDEEEQNIL